MPVFATPPTTNAFDYNAFSWAYFVMDIVPSFNNIVMDRLFRVVAAGQAVTLLCNIQDIMTTPGKRFNFNPATTPQVEIYNPDGTTKVAFTNMNFVSTGFYNYQHQVATSDQKGTYTAVFKAVNGTMVGMTDKLAVFEAV